MPETKEELREEENPETSESSRTLSESLVGLPAPDAAAGARKRKKKRILLTVLLILVLLAIISAIALAVDWKSIIAPVYFREVKYYKPAWNEKIFENEEYLSHLGWDMTVSIEMQGEPELRFAYEDYPTAEAAFGGLSGFGNGAETLGKYFYALLCGCRNPAQQQDFRALFAKEYAVYGGGGKVSDKEKSLTLPLSFPPQKVYGVSLRHMGTFDLNGAKTERWRVSFEVVKNDGTVLNYTGARDGGEAWFFLAEENGVWKIVQISGIIQVN